MKELNGNFTLTDNDAVFIIRMDSGCAPPRAFKIGAREHLDLESLTRKFLKAEFGECYQIRNVAIERNMGGPNECTIYTMDHFERQEFESPEELADYLSEGCVCWNSGNFYFDAEEYISTSF